MYVLCVQNPYGQRVNFVSTTKTALKEHIAKAKEVGADWRLWNNGWIDGSPDAWCIFQSIVNEPATILY